MVVMAAQYSKVLKSHMAAHLLCYDAKFHVIFASVFPQLEVYIVPKENIKNTGVK